MFTDMLRDLGRNWGWIGMRGVVAVLFGVLAIAWPGLTLAALVIVWGAYALADGLLALVAAWRVRGQGRPFWSLVLVGLLGIAAGVSTFFWPAITALALLMVIAASWQRTGTSYAGASTTISNHSARASTPCWRRRKSHDGPRHQRAGRARCRLPARCEGDEGVRAVDGAAGIGNRGDRQHRNRNSARPPECRFRGTARVS